MRKAGAKEDFEGSIGSKGVVGVNQSPVLAGRQSDFMIQFCMCTRRISSSSLCNLNDTDILMTCKGCSGESTSDRGGPSCSSKLNGMGLELPRPIDPEVRWKTVKRRQRAARRARTSFSGEDRMKDQIGSFYAFGNVASKGVGHKDAPVSESEKLGVSILGRRFSDPMENVPIKKRRFQMDCSPSPPSTPLLVDPHEKLLSSSSGGISSYERRRKAKILGGESKEEKKGAFDADDFSGISILAAAACESGMDGDVLDGACSKLAHPLEETKSESTIGSTELSLLHGMEEDKLKIQEASHCIYDGPNRPLESSKSASDMKPLFATTLSSSENLVESASVPKVNCSLYYALSSVNKTDVSECSNVAIRDSSSNPDKSVGNSQVTAVQTKRDSTRLHWDLNVEMEAWDTECGGDDDHIAAAISNHDDAGNDMNKPQTSHDLFGSTDAGNLPDVTSDKIHIVDEPKDDKTKDKDDTPADSSPHALRPQSPQTLQLLESESTGNDTSAEKMVLPDQHKSTFAPIMESHLGSNPEPAPVAEHFPLMANVEKIDGSHPSSVDGEGLSHAGGNSIQTSDLGSTVKPLASRIVSEESTSHQPVASFNKKGTNFVWSDNKLEEASRHSISEFKNQELLDVDSGTSKIEQSVNNKAEHDTDVLHAIESTADPESLTQPEGDPGSSGCDMAHVHEEDGADAMINSKDSLVPCANSSSAETYYISSAVPQAPGPNSECTTQGVTDACSIVDSHTAAQSYQNGYKDELRKVASDSCLEHCSETDASHISRHLTGIGEVDVEEEDSQYEDGELRESGDGYWADDGYEEVKRANWHYNVSDYKNEAGTPGLPSHPIDSIPKNMDITAAGYNRIQARKEGGAVTPVSSKRSWSTNCLDDGSGTIYAASTGGKARSIHLRVTCDSQMYDVHPGRVAAGTAETFSQSQRCSDGLGDNLLSTGMKSTGWDMPPEDQRHSRHYSREGADSSTRCVLSSLDAAEGDELLRKTGPSKTDVQRVERPRSFERSHRNELSRSDDGYSTGSKAERTNDSNRSYGIYDAKRHIQAGSRGEQWVKNSKHPRSTHRRSPDYYNYGPSGPRNAAEAAVAKMESNGFVVAPDGTLVRAADPANAGHMARRMRNTLNSSYRPLAGRGSPVDRDTACGLSRGAAHAREASSEHFGASSNRSGRYGPDMQKDNTTDGSLSSVHCSLSSKQRGIRTGRASINLSRAHSRSPSGSRSRSPHDWTSPRNRRKIMANGGSTLRRHSRSPPNMTKARMGRMNSPQRQHGFDDRATRYSPPSRNNTYPQHASTWADGRNCSTEDPSDRNRRFSRRSPLRNTSRNDRFDVMDSEGRSRSGEFYRPAQGRLPYGYERGNKNEGSGDHPREYADRYGSHSVKPYDRNGAVKQFRNNTGDKFRTRISSPRSPELQRRGSPRRFDRGFEK